MANQHFDYSLAKELLRGNEFFQGLTDDDLDYILIMKLKNAVRQKRLQAFRHRKLKSQVINDLRRWSPCKA